MTFLTCAYSKLINAPKCRISSPSMCHNKLRLTYHSILRERPSLNLSSTTIHELTQLISQFTQNKSVKTTHMTIQVLVHNLRPNLQFVNHKYTETDKTYRGCTINCVVHTASRFHTGCRVILYGNQRQSRSFEGALFTGIGMCTQQHMHNTK